MHFASSGGRGLLRFAGKTFNLRALAFFCVVRQLSAQFIGQKHCPDRVTWGEARRYVRRHGERLQCIRPREDSGFGKIRTNARHEQ